MRAIGASNYKGERLAKSLEISKQLGTAPVRSLQPLYNLYDRADYEATLEPVCRKNAIGVIPYFALASGFLTGKYRSENDLSKSPRGQGVKKYLNARGFRILAALDEVAAKLHSTPAKVSLAWLMAQPGITAPIASATNLDQLNDLIDATSLALDRSSLAFLDQASAELIPSGQFQTSCRLVDATCPVSRASSDGRCNTIWYKAVFKGGVYEARETVWAFGGAEERRVASLEGRADAA